LDRRDATTCEGWRSGSCEDITFTTVSIRRRAAHAQIASSYRERPSPQLDQNLTTGQFPIVSFSMWKAKGPHLQAFSTWS
jgi:hypothetical protein